MYTSSPENIILTNGAVRLFFHILLGVLIPDGVLGSTGRRDWILWPVMGPDYHLGLDHETLVGQILDGRTLQEHVGLPSKGTQV